MSGSAACEPAASAASPLSRSIAVLSRSASSAVSLIAEARRSAAPARLTVDLSVPLICFNSARTDSVSEVPSRCDSFSSSLDCTCRASSAAWLQASLCCRSLGTSA